MKSRITINELFEKFGNEFQCRVWYHDQTTDVYYESSRNVKWKNVRRVTVIFKNKKRYRNGRGESLSRDGATYIIE
jgi:hypothetical protein